MLGFFPISSGPLSEILDAQVTQTTTTTVRFASETITTRATDSPANELILGKIARGLQVDRRLETVDRGQFGALVETTFGEVVLNNADGALDDLATKFAADGRQIRLKIGSTEITTSGQERPQPYAQFATVYISTAGSWNFEHDLRLRIEGLNNRIQDRLQQETYAGVGGIEGTVEIAGRTRPALFGRCSNVSPQLLDPAILTYQLHSGNIEQISAVYDGGAGGAHDITFDFAFAGDFPTYAALAAASVPAGAYATSLAVGCLRLGVAPLREVTVDARGHKDNITGNYIETTADLIRTILRDYAGINTNLIDHTAFNALNGLQPGDVGMFLPAGDQSTVTDVIRQLAFGAGAFISDRSGRFSIQRLDPPSATIVHWAFTDRDILDNSFRRLDLPYLIPWKAWGVGYDVNWTEQHDSDLAGGVSQTRRTYLQSKRRFVYVQSPSIAQFHATSHGAPLRESFFANAATAEAEAQRLLGLYAYGRALYEIVVKTALFSVHVGQTVRITYHRWQLGGGKNFVVVGVADDADRVETTLRVFG